MSVVTEAISNHHRQLGKRFDAELTALEQGVSDGAALVAFLQEELAPHAAGEERSLYPVVADLVREHGAPTATMSLDHEYIEATTQEITALMQAMRATVNEEERAHLRQRLVRAGIQLSAVVRLHTAKEERAYLPLVDTYLNPTEQERLLETLHEEAEARERAGSTAAPDAPEELDVRPMAPAQRHGTIFATFSALPAGGAFILINDHDPKPLYYQFSAELAGQFTWDYLETGTHVWRVRIGKAS